MAKIKQLSQHEAQKIAAGEVVERPANIVKELVENSIDAGATRISIYIEDAGKQLIRVVDNGCGMDAVDARICFDRHATSKITHVDQLETIDTFGFRGEALASIASVSQVSLITKEEKDLEGVQILIDANTIKEVNTVACVTGTDISIAHLFFNVPARKKFLKTTATEWRAIQLLFNAFCFDYPYIHFSLFTENKQVNNCPAVDSVSKRALQIWEPHVHQHLIPLEADDAGCALTGVISDHQQYRYDRSGIYFFVNKRWVKNQQLASALIKGYANVIPEGRCPVAAINITVPAHEVDINIHPRKEEVKFLHPRKIEQALQLAVKKALENTLSQHIKKEVVFKPAEQSYSQQSRGFAPFDFNSFFAQHNDAKSIEYRSGMIADPFPFKQENISTVIVGGQNKYNNTHDIKDDALSSSEHVNRVESQALLSDTFAITKENHEQEASDVVTSHNEYYRLIGQYNKTYLLIEKEEGLFLVDQHAAHERILYELFANRFAQVATIQLLFPQIITLSAHDINLVLPHLDILIDNGIIIEQYAQDQLIIQSLPVHLKEQSLSDLIKEMISWVVEHASVQSEMLKKTINNKLQAQMACKAAVKAGDELTHEKMQQLLTDLEKTANRFSCPHGRPTGWLLSLNEIEKKFKRKL